MNKNKLLILMAMGIPVITTGFISTMEANAVESNLETRATASMNSYKIENVTDEGFDFTVKFNSDVEVTSLHLPYWKYGNYNARIESDNDIQRIGYNEFKIHIKMSNIGSGTEYVYFGLHPRFADGTSGFSGDLCVKLDTTNPNLNLSLSNTNWTNQNITLNSVSNDNQNIIEYLSYYHKDNTLTKYNMYSNPKILLIQGYHMSAIAEKYYGNSNVTMVQTADITSVSQLKGYDIVIYDGRYWGIDANLALLLNQAFEQGVSLITNLNDDPEQLSIVTGSHKIYNNATYLFNEYKNDTSGYAPTGGRINRFAYLMNGKSEFESGYHTTTAGTGAFVISTVSHDDGTKTPGILMRTHSNGNKWIHVQGSDLLPKYALDRAVDEIMCGTMKTRQTYNKGFTISENGTYSVEVEDFFGNKTKKSITVTNIDKVAPTLNITGNPTSWTPSATLTVTGSDDLSGVKEIVLPNGTIVTSSTTSYTITANGNYTFKVRDKAGNETTQTISVTKIDNTINSLTGLRQSMSVVNTDTSTRRMTFNFNAVSDSQSGLKGYSYVIDKVATTVPDNTVDTTSTTITKDITDTGVYYLHIKAIDNAGNVSGVVHKKVDVAKLTSVANTSKNMIRLDWTMNDLNNKTFKVYQKKPGSNTFQSVGTTNFDTNTQVKVLNIYPPNPSFGSMITFTTWKGETCTLPITASLKKWMEEPNAEHPKGYGQGLINVDAVAFDDFNANPNTYLKNTDGSWKYDVIMFGTADSNNSKDLNTVSLQATKDFIDAGKGVLFGHDTVTQWQGRANFPKLQDYINVKTYGFTGSISSVTSPSEIWTLPWSGGDEVSITKKGILTNFPWQIGDIGTKLTVPYTHTNSQIAKGDVWMKFSNPKADTVYNVPIDVNEHTDNGVGTNMAYLTSWNNTAMVQTGHSIGRYAISATPDEQKLLANTLFYLNQLSSNNYLDDYSGQDVSAPTKPTLSSVNINTSGVATFNINASTDNGSTYEYYVESQTKDSDNLTYSNTTKTTITSGLKGYSYVIDSSPSTIPNDTVNTTSTSINANITSNNMYLHIKAIDNQGNASDTLHYQLTDTTKPTISIGGNPTTWTNQNVTLTVNGSDVGTGVKHIVLPNGNIVTGSNASYTVSANGNYTFKVVDKMGNETTQTISVTKIDKTINTLSGVNENMTMVNADTSTRRLTFTFNPVSDTQSGLKGYSYVIDKVATTIPDNTVDTTATTITKDITDGGVYYLHIKAIDNAGNVSNVVHKKVDIPSLTAKANPSANNIRLDWTMNDIKNKTFKVYQKKPGSSEYQSVSMTNFDDTTKVNVLNIYPVRTNDTNLIPMITFSTWDGETLTLPKSASLKQWMESPNNESAKGYGKGIIEVTPVSIDEFNANYNSIMKNSDGSWKYDVIMLGSWDGTANTYPTVSNSAVDLIATYIKDGKGFLTGHDTVGYIQGTQNGIGRIRDLFNIKVGKWNWGDAIPDEGHSYFGGFMSSKVNLQKKGLLTNYPWNLGEVGTQFTIPTSHSTSNFAYGDIWMTYPNDALYPGNEIPSSLYPYANFYLTTWNNTAMIQTGHSNGQATADEQKILANTLFYLNQLSSDNFLNDNSGQDVTAPNKPVINSAKFTEDGYINLSFNSVTDNGSTYKYYVESQTKDNDNLTLSNTVTETITSGLKGYSYVVDSNATTIPDDTIEQATNETIKIKTNNSGELYVHIKAIDNAGNGSETYHYRITDTTKPTLTVTQNPTTWTNGSVTLTATASDSGSGVKYIILPNGNIVSSSTASYTVDKNGMYYFKAVDYMGNETVQGVNVTNIDKNKPTVTITNNQNWTNQNVQVTITSKDE